MDNKILYYSQKLKLRRLLWPQATSKIIFLARPSLCQEKSPSFYCLLQTRKKRVTKTPSAYLETLNDRLALYQFHPILMKEQIAELKHSLKKVKSNKTLEVIIFDMRELRSYDLAGGSYLHKIVKKLKKHKKLYFILIPSEQDIQLDPRLLIISNSERP